MPAERVPGQSIDQMLGGVVSMSCVKHGMRREEMCDGELWDKREKLTL